MKRLRLTLLAILLAIGAPTLALAANCASYTYTLTNGTTADANQVMANFNTIMSCANNNLAHSGANSDITSLSSLSTPLSVSQGGTGLATLTAGSPLVGNGVGALAAGLSTASNAISGNVALNNTASFFDGPSIAQGSTGTWFVSGAVTVQDNAGAATFAAKLWDGTTVIATGGATTSGATTQVTISLSGFLASPAANLRISVIDATSTSGVIVAGVGGAGNHAGTISAMRIE